MVLIGRRKSIRKDLGYHNEVLNDKNICETQMGGAYFCGLDSLRIRQIFLELTQICRYTESRESMIYFILAWSCKIGSGCFVWLVLSF